MQHRQGNDTIGAAVFCDKLITDGSYSLSKVGMTNGGQTAFCITIIHSQAIVNFLGRLLSIIAAL